MHSMGTRHVFDLMAYHQKYGVLSRTLISNTEPGPILKYNESPVFVNGAFVGETPPSSSLQERRSQGQLTPLIHLKSSLSPVHGVSSPSITQHHPPAPTSRASCQGARAAITHVKSLSVDAAPFQPDPNYHTPSAKARAAASASQSLPHLRAQPRHFDSGQMLPFPPYYTPSPGPYEPEWDGGPFPPYYTPSPGPHEPEWNGGPIPSYYTPSLGPHEPEWNGGRFSPYAPHAPHAPHTGFQQTYHAQRVYQGESNGAMTTANPYDPFTAATPSLATANHATHQPQLNPYTQDTNTMGGASYYQSQNSFAQPVRRAST